MKNSATTASAATDPAEWTRVDMRARSTMRQVVVVQNSLLHYRVPLFQALRSRLLDEQINLRLFHGQSTNCFTSTLPWAEPFERLPRIGKFVYHPILRPLFGADLIIVEHATKHLTNYIAFLISRLDGRRLAFWGHGRNRQTETSDSFSERVKTWMGKRSDWYFAYTSNVRDELIERGYDSSRITNVQNAIAAPSSLPDEREVDSFRQTLSIPPNAIVAIYCGQMNPIKQLKSLIEAARLVHHRMPTFRLILAGNGADQPIAEEAARQYDYVHYLGPVFDARKTVIFGLAHLCVMPGSVGLGILDAFHHGSPPIVVDTSNHGPEIAYLRDGVNGICTANSPEGLAEGILRVGTDSQLSARLMKGCKETAAQITIESMVDRFSAGIIRALET